MSYKTLTIDDISGGMTDNVKLSKTNQFEILNNIIVNPENGGTKVWGSKIFSPTVYTTPSGEKTNYFSEMQDTNFVSAGRRLYEFDTTAITEITGPSGNHAYSTGLADSSIYSSAMWRNHIIYTNNSYALPIKIYQDAAGDWQVRTAGLPDLASDPTVTGVAGALTYIYAFCHYYTYTVGATVFEDFGPCTYVQVAAINAPNVSAVAIAAIPTLANAGTGNYDTTTITVKIWRTLAGQQTFYYVGEVANGTAIYNDVLADATIQTTNIRLYTNGGILDNDSPPPSNYVSILNGVGYYGGVYEDGVYKSYRARMSKANDIDSCPVDFTVDFDGDITGQVPYREKMIYFVKNGTLYQTYSVTGHYDSYGRGTPQKILISSSEGSVNHNSIAIIGNGVVFAGSKGFCFTDGYQVYNISDTMTTSYFDIISSDAKKSRIHATYDPKNKLVYFACQRNKTSVDNDAFFILHEDKGIKKESCFTTRDNANDFQPCAIYFNTSDQLVRGDTRGFIFVHEEGLRADPKVDLTVGDPNLWATSHIPWDITTSELLGDSNSVQKYGSKVGCRLKTTSNVSVQLFSANDGYKNWKELPEIRRRDNMTWTAPYHYWEGALPYWSYTKDINEMRWLPSQGTIRFYTKQLKLTPSFTVIERSDDRCTATVGALAFPITVTLDEPATYNWAAACQDFFLYTDIDDYAVGLPVIQRANDSQIIVTDPTGVFTLPNVSFNWMLKGYPKDEYLDFVSMTLYYGDGSPSLTPYVRSSSGENA